MKFEYNGRIYSPSNLEKKLQKMGITINDIKIIEKKEEIKEFEDEEKNLYYFINKDNGYKHCSIYNRCPDGYEKCTKEEYNGNIRTKNFRTKRQLNNS